MQHIIYTDAPQYPIAILIRKSSMNKDRIKQHYISKLSTSDVIVFDLDHDDDGKASAATIKKCLQNLEKPLTNLNVQHIYVTDPAYYKTLMKLKKVTNRYGYSSPGKFPGYENKYIILGIDYSLLFDDPNKINLLNRTLMTLESSFNGTYKPPKNTADIRVLTTPDEITAHLDTWLNKPIISCDIETFGLEHHTAGIASIAFACSPKEAIVFAVDLSEHKTEIRDILKTFFLMYKGTCIYHNATFDIKILSHVLLNPNNTYEDQLKGVKHLTLNCHCTQIIAYLATNNAQGNNLKLKHLAQEFAGDWAEDVKDVTKIPLEDLLEYNAQDALATYWVFETYFVKMIDDNQYEIYKTIFQPMIPCIINIELNGFPMNKQTIREKYAELTAIRDTHLNYIKDSLLIKEFNIVLRVKAQIERNSKLKTKQVGIEEFNHIEFNPGSDKQLRQLFHEEWNLPVFSLTDSKKPSTDADALNGLLQYLLVKNNTTLDEVLLGQFSSELEKIRIINSVIELNKLSTILSTFFVAFDNGFNNQDGRSYLHGSFNLTGTVSGRLSSSSPNMQNLPSKGTIYAKTVKECFEPPEGWVLCGADFDSLEDKISALTTKDPNKLAVYLHGYDGHCLRAYSYFKEQIPDIEMTAESINSIEKKYPKLRQASKAPTFLLTYGGTHHGLQKNCGLPKDQAIQIESNYHELYKVSDQWVANQLKQAAITGYVEGAFGIRLRTPLIQRTIANTNSTPYKAKAEARTAGNALGQSYGLLNSRAACEFMQQVEASEYRLDIKTICLIHDAIYLVIRNDPKIIAWAAENLLKCMAWQDLPAIQHDQVKISASFSVFTPTWANEIKIPARDIAGTLQSLL